MNGFDTGFCARMLILFAHFIWQGTLILVAAFIARRLLSKHSAAARYNVLLAALALMAAAPPATWLCLPKPVSPPAAIDGYSDASAPLQADGTGLRRLPAGWEQPPPVGSRRPPLAAGSLQSAGASEARSWKDFAPYGVACYLIGVAVMLVRLMLAVRGVQRIRRQSTPLADERMLQAVARQARRLGMHIAPAVAQCHGIVVPAVLGVVKPAILLPVSLSTLLTAEQIELLLAHELAHLKRYDPIVNFLQRVLEAALFFHPAVWIVSKWVRIEREHCCDDLAVNDGKGLMTYAESLVRIAELAPVRRGFSAQAALALGADGRPSRLGTRIHRLLGESEPERLHAGSVWTLAVALVAVSLMAIHLAITPAPAAETARTTARNGSSQSSRAQILDRKHRVLARSDGQDAARVHPLGTLAAHLIEAVEPATAKEQMHGGTRLVLTLDAEIQQKLEEQLARRVEFHNADSAVGVVMKIESGEVLAMADYPGFDLSRTDKVSDKTRVSRVLTEPVEPGSVFKPFIMSAVMADRAAAPDERIDCKDGTMTVGNQVLHDAQSYGEITVSDILAKSSNIGMAILGQRLGNAKIHAMLSGFGFGEKTGVDLPDENAGRMLPLEKWSTSSMASIAMGQEVAATPIQLISAFSAICNEGRLLRPRVVASLEDDNGRIVEDRRTVEERRRVITPDIARTMVAMLAKVCIDGTGRECKLDHWQVLGKTGTVPISRVGEDRSGNEPQAYLASFIAAAPVNHPQLAVLIMTRHPRKNGNYGSAVSLPAVKETLNFALNYLDVPHESKQSGTETE